jgi:CheY-like chemotaxis protein
LQALASESVDLVITDIFMAVMDGMETVAEVKKLYPQLKIIAMSGGSQFVVMDALPVAKVLGADRTLAKPMQFEALLALIAELDAEWNS